MTFPVFTRVSAQVRGAFVNTAFIISILTATPSLATSSNVSNDIDTTTVFAAALDLFDTQLDRLRRSKFHSRDGLAEARNESTCNLDSRSTN